MPHLNNSNCDVDPFSGGINFKGSPELQEINKLKTDLKNLQQTVETLKQLVLLLSLGGGENATRNNNTGQITFSSKKI